MIFSTILEEMRVVHASTQQSITRSLRDLEIWRTIDGRARRSVVTPVSISTRSRFG